MGDTRSYTGVQAPHGEGKNPSPVSLGVVLVYEYKITMVATPRLKTSFRLI